MLTTPILLGIASALASILVDRFFAKPHAPTWFGLVKLTYVRTAAAGAFAGLSMSGTWGRLHRKRLMTWKQRSRSYRRLSLLS